MAFDDINVPKYTGKREEGPIIGKPNSNHTSYVYDNTEVVKTGRTAARNLSSGKQDVQFEVTPKFPMNGNWKKWVRESDLYLIEGDTDV